MNVTTCKGGYRRAHCRCGGVPFAFLEWNYASARRPRVMALCRECAVRIGRGYFRACARSVVLMLGLDRDVTPEGAWARGFLLTPPPKTKLNPRLN